MKQPPPPHPRTKDRMASRYWEYGWQPPVSRNGRQIWPTRWRRRVEKNTLRRYLERMGEEE